MIKFVVKPGDKGWVIYRDGVLGRVYPTQRAAMAALSKMRKELRAKGERSTVRLEPRERSENSN